MQKSNQQEISGDEYAVINAVLAKAVPADSTYKNEMLWYLHIPRFLPASVHIDTAKENLERMEQICKLKKELNAHQLSTYISDSLIHFPGHYLNYIHKAKLADLQKSSLTHPYVVRSIALTADTNVVATHFDTSNINSLYHYRTRFYHNKSPRKKDEYSPGDVQLSRVIFNKQKNRACVYVDTYRGPKYARGTMYILIKKNNHWIVVEQDMLWTA